MSDATKRRNLLADFVTRMVKEQPLGIGGGIVVSMFIFVAVFADVLAPYGILEPHLADRLQGSSAQYPLGTDQLGRDFLSRVIYGARLSIGVGLAATSLNVVVALLIGGTSRIPRWQVRPGGAEICRCLDGFPGTADLVDDNVPGRAGRNPDDSRSGYSRRHRRLKGYERRGRRNKGECLFPGRRGDWLLQMASVCTPCAA